MKKVLIFAVVLSVLGGLYVGAAHITGGLLPVPFFSVGGDRGQLRRIAMLFLQDLQFKDYAQAASYHSKADQELVDIPYLIQKLFQIRPEALDLMDYEVVKVDLDDGGNRARVKVRMKAKLLLDNSIK